MNIYTLHRRIIHDADLLIDGVNCVLPVIMPKRYALRKMNLGSFIKRLNVVTEPFNVVNEIRDDVTVERGTALVSAAWYPEDLLPEKDSVADIRVTWHLHPFAHRIKIRPGNWSRRRFYFWERILHELVHRHQCIARPEDQGTRTYRVRQAADDVAVENQKYLGDYDELEAHAHDAALEMLLWWPECTAHQAISKIAECEDRASMEFTYVTYLTAFEPGHPARAQFKRKTTRWYEAMKQTPEFYQKLALAKE